MNDDRQPCRHGEIVRMGIWPFSKNAENPARGEGLGGTRGPITLALIRIGRLQRLDLAL